MVQKVKLMQEKNGAKKQIFPITHIDAVIGAISGKGIVEATQYGAKGDGRNDDTVAIQKAISFLNDGDTLKLSGKFLISKQGIDLGKHSYALIIENKNNITLDFDNATFITKYTDDLPNFFEIINCNNVHIKGGYFTTIYGTNGNSGLYQGGIYIYGCSNVLVENQEFDNTKYGVLSFSSYDILIRHTLFHHNLHLEPSKNKPWSAIIMYDTVRGIAQGNSIYGGLQDGDLSVFGGKTQDCMVLNNKLYTFKYGDKTQTIINMKQGITIDQGPTNTQVVGNVVYGYYFGIDNKANAFQTNIENNFITACKIGIADRRGESQTADQTLNTVIKNNIINFGTFPDQTDFNPWGIQAVAIWIENRLGADISNNKIQVPKEFDVSKKIVAGMYLSQKQDIANQDYKTPFKISSNFINLLEGHDADYRTVSRGSIGIIINGIKDVTLTNNIMNLPVFTYPFVIKGKNKKLFFSANNINPTAFNTFSIEKEATIDYFYNLSNVFGDSLNGLDSQTQITKATTNEREVVTNSIVSTSNYSDVITVSGKYDNSRAIISIEAVQSGSGIYGYNKYFMTLDSLTSARIEKIFESGNLTYRITNIGPRKFKIQAINSVRNTTVKFKVNIYADNQNISIG